LRRDGGWKVAGSHAAGHRVGVRFSPTLLGRVVAERRTFYQDPNLNQSIVVSTSLQDVEALVASPIFGLNGEVVGALYGVRYWEGLARGGIRPLEAQFVQLLAGAVGANLARGTAQRTRVQFEQFFSPELVRELERDPNLLEGRSQVVTILVSDLRGFSGLSERLGAQQTCVLIRDMMERLSEQIVRQGGVIVDYAGDGILAMWNAPTPQEDHALRACRAALAMLGELGGLNERWREVAGGPLALGIGINTGTAQVGNTGSPRKFKYGPHGHTVNLASRVQDATKILQLPLLVTSATCDLLPPTLPRRRLGRVRLAGVEEQVVLYEVQAEPPPAEWQTLRDGYEAALALYEDRQWGKACQRLLPLLEAFERSGHLDAPTLKLMRRAGECLEARPEPFDAVIEVTKK
jgi:adenylate cyclase